MSITDYYVIKNRHLIVTDTTTGDILLNQAIDNVHFTHDTINNMITDIISDVVYFDKHSLSIKLGYES